MPPPIKTQKQKLQIGNRNWKVIIINPTMPSTLWSYCSYDSSILYSEVRGAAHSYNLLVYYDTSPS